MKIKLIACESLKDEFISLKPKANMEFLDYNLHNEPEELNQELKIRIERESEADTIVLGYGLCSNAVVGLKSETQRIVIPLVHDCIALLMGSAGKYIETFSSSYNNFYLSRGWIDYGIDPMKDYYRYVDKYGKEHAKWIINEMYKNYRKIVFIDTGVCEQSHFMYAQQVARFMSWNYEEITGSVKLLRNLVNGDWDKDFLVVSPGELVEQESFLCQECFNKWP